MRQKDADGMTRTVDLDQTAPLGSGPKLFPSQSGSLIQWNR